MPSPLIAATALPNLRSSGGSTKQASPHGRSRRRGTGTGTGPPPLAARRLAQAKQRRQIGQTQRQRRPRDEVDQVRRRPPHVPELSLHQLSQARERKLMFAPPVRTGADRDGGRHAAPPAP